MAEFLKPEELGKLAEAWYGIERELEGLRHFSTAGEALAERLEEIGEAAAGLGRLAGEVCVSAMHHLPEKREFFQRAMEELESAAEELRTRALNSAGMLRRRAALEAELAELEAELGQAEKEAGRLKGQAEDACGRAERLRAELERRVAEIREETDAGLVEIREAFAARVEGLLAGRGVRLYGRQASALEVLEELIREPEAGLEVQGEGGGELVRALRRLAQECAGRMRAVLLREKHRIAEAEAELRLQEAEERCRALRAELERAESRLASLGMRAEELGGELAGLGVPGGYAGVLELREELMRILERCSLRRALFAELERIHEVEPEDPEKRDLRLRIRELEEELEAERREAASLRRRAEELAGLRREAEEAAEALRAELEEARAELELLRRREEALKAELAELRKVAERERRAAAMREKELRERLEELGRRAAELEEQLAGERREAGRLRGELRRLERRLRVLEGRREREDRGGAEEEAYLSEKLSALRRRR